LICTLLTSFTPDGPPGSDPDVDPARSQPGRPGRRSHLSPPGLDRPSLEPSGPALATAPVAQGLPALPAVLALEGDAQLLHLVPLVHQALPELGHGPVEHGLDHGPFHHEVGLHPIAPELQPDLEGAQLLGLQLQVELLRSGAAELVE